MGPLKACQNCIICKYVIEDTHRDGINYSSASSSSRETYLEKYNVCDCVYKLWS